MLKRVLPIIMIFTILFIFSGCYENTITINDEQSLIRIHIRADSNDESDQAVKLKVRDEIVAYLEKSLYGITDFDKAYELISGSLGTLKRRSESVLKQNGFYYGANVSLKKEYFPTRMYGNVVVESGTYDALIIELGSGKGDNWWCVVYPPMCYLDGDGDIKFKSRIKELIDKYC